MNLFEFVYAKKIATIGQEIALHIDTVKKRKLQPPAAYYPIEEVSALGSFQSKRYILCLSTSTICNSFYSFVYSGFRVLCMKGSVVVVGAPTTQPPAATPTAKRLQKNRQELRWCRAHMLEVTTPWRES